MRKLFLVFISFFLLGVTENKIATKKGVINFDGNIREYYFSFPKNTLKPFPLIINFHGFSSHAIEQQEFSQMDNYVHQNGSGVIYP